MRRMGRGLLCCKIRLIVVAGICEEVFSLF